MARERVLLFSCNGGLVSPLALARVDLARMKLTADVFTNLLPKAIGPMQFRPGSKYISGTNGNGIARNLPFIFSVDDTAKIELSDLTLRVAIDDAYITRNSVATTITNGDFSNAAGWDASDTTPGGSADVNATHANALTLVLTARGGLAVIKRSFTVAAPDRNREHGIRIVVTRGTVKFRLGSTDGGYEYLGEMALGPGTHSLAFIPTTATAWVQFSCQSETEVIVDSVQIEPGGEMQLTTEYSEADLWSLRYQQSGDVIFVTNQHYAPRRIERHNERGDKRSWSFVLYQFVDGPFRGKTSDVTLSSSVTIGNGTMTASAKFFDARMVGAVFQLTHTNTTSTVSLAGDDTYTDTVRIAGKDQGPTRAINRSVSGTWNTTIRTIESADKDGPWSTHNANTGNYSDTITPGADNEILFVKIGFQTGDYTSGVANCSISTAGGGGDGVVRITGYNSPTSVDIEVMSRLHHTGETTHWQEGKYSEYRGWPNAVDLFEGRLWFGGADQIAGSFSDNYVGFNVDEEGDSAPIVRSIATGPVNKVQWILGMARLVFGTSGAESVARSSSFDEPMTATNFSIKDASTYGSADIQAVKMDRSGFFIGRSGKLAYQLGYDVTAQDYTSIEVTRYSTSVLEAGVKVMAVQRQPDSRVWCVLNDGRIAILTITRTEEDVLAWATFETDGQVQDICVLPNTEADDVSLIVRRRIGGVDQYFQERLAYESQALGGSSNFMADSHVVRTLAAETVVAGLDHLEGEEVVAWAGGAAVLDDDGEPRIFTVSGGSITLPQRVTGTAVAGLAYEGFWRSTKLAYATTTPTAISQKKIIETVTPLLYKTHIRGIRMGQSFDRMDPLPRNIHGVSYDANVVLEDYDNDQFAIPGNWKNDPRLCLKFVAPLPATVMGIVMGLEGHERS